MKDEHLDGVSICPLLKDGSAQLKREKLYWHYLIIIGRSLIVRFVMESWSFFI